ncbi:MAG: HEAT repeat domain-containing protein [Acidobacteriota bacterium]|nr:MAG: HEAT repeat domain-containing protein [Acidobacteriota bacterium]
MAVSPNSGTRISDWLEDLASPESSVAEAAAEALLAHGDAAVSELQASLDADEERLRLRVISLLSLLSRPGTAGPLISLLHDPSPRIRSRAAGALARISSPAVTAALTRLLQRERQSQVRLTAVRALIRLVITGHEEALRPLLDRMSDPGETARVRGAAMDVFAWVTGEDNAEPVRAMLKRLAEDPDAAVSSKARRLLESPVKPRLEPWALEQLLDDLGSRKMATWRRAVTLLVRAGGNIIEPLVQAMLARAKSLEYARRAALVLKELSPRQLSRLGPYLDVLEEPIALETLVDVVQESGSRQLTARLATLIERLACGPESNGPGPLDKVRQLAHLALARDGSRMATEDLRRLLEDPRYPLRTALVEAVAEIGTRTELPALVRAYLRSRGIARLGIREATHAVARREKIRRSDRVIASLEPIERQAAIEILGLPRRGKYPVSLRRPRVDSASHPLLP